MSTGLILSAPSSGAGKTTLTLGLLRALSRKGVGVRGAKSGPDYIDPRFHAAACGAPCPNLDAWAMTPDRIRALAAGDGLLLIEGAMGLFDGAPPDGKGATADLARILDLPVVLIVDAAKTAQSVAPLVSGFVKFDRSVNVAGAILNNIGSLRHEAMLRKALAPIGVPVLGALHRQKSLIVPSRHLGLVQASEREDLDQFLNHAADLVEASVDLERFAQMAGCLAPPSSAARLPPPAQKIAVARDRAFAFSYPHLLADWRSAGAEINFFSPLADDPVPESDFVFLPGGYPELYGADLAAATRFRGSIRHRAQIGTRIYGECGGYMVLGKSLTDASGKSHPMLDLLELETSFASRKLHLGYRHLSASTGPFRGRFKGHEFHYATTVRASGTALFQATDAEGMKLADMGLQHGPVSGSFAHIIDHAY